jgi:formate dehydrogenase accessory protein FdhD
MSQPLRSAAIEAEPALPAPTVSVTAELLRRGAAEESVRELLAEECPVALVYNGLSHAVMMASPVDLEDFALGFSLTEGIAETPAEVTDVEVLPAGAGIEARLTVTARAFMRLKERRRALSGRTGCGLCGVESLDQALRALPPVRSDLSVSAIAVERALDALAAEQTLNRDVHSLHAAAFCDRNGHILLVREDVGRHNALDKLIGAMAGNRIDAGQGFAVITSRCSFEMAQKAVAAGIPILAAVSAPTHLAVKLAEAHDLTLLALARKDSMKLFTARRRIVS